MKNGAYNKDNKPVYVKTFTSDSISNSAESEIVMARAMHNIHVSARRIADALEKIANQPKPEPIDLNGLANFVATIVDLRNKCARLEAEIAKDNGGVKCH